MEKNKRAINVHLGADLKARWVAYCESLNKKPGAALKEAIEQKLLMSAKSDQSKFYRQTESGRQGNVRFEILLKNQN